jgi:hypothetical protein
MNVCAACAYESHDIEAGFCARCGLPIRVVAGEQPAGRRPGERNSIPSVSGGRDAAPSTVAAYLGTRRLPVYVGGEATLEVRVRNSGSRVDELTVAVKGAPAAWSEVVPARLPLMPGTDGYALVRFRPPKTPGPIAGPLAFTVEVRSREYPGSLTEEAGVVEIAAARELGAEMVPASARASRSASYELVVENRGNTALAVEITGTELDATADVRIKPDRLSLAPDVKEIVRVHVTARHPMWLGKTERRQLRIDISAADTTPLAVTGVFVQEPRIPTWLPKLGGAAMAGALALAVVATATFGQVVPETPGPIAGSSHELDRTSSLPASPATTLATPGSSVSGRPTLTPIDGTGTTSGGTGTTSGGTGTTSGGTGTTSGGTGTTSGGTGTTVDPPVTPKPVFVGEYEGETADVIRYEIEQDVLSDKTVVLFVIQLGVGVTWRKELDLPGEGERMYLGVQDGPQPASMTIPVDRVAHSWIGLRKMKFLGGMWEVATATDSRWTGGSRVVITWVHD